MSITINTTPANIDNSGAFSVTTSLVEDSTHVNLRIRAEIYHEGVIKTNIEKPKGITDFDFGDILKNLVPGFKMVRNTGDMAQTGSIGANLITGWSVSSGTFDVLTTSTNTITRAQKIAAAAAFAKTNNISFEAGSIYVLYVLSYVTSGSKAPYITLPAANCLQANTEYLVNNKSMIIMPTTTGSGYIEIGRSDGEFDFTGIYILNKITTNRSTIGGLVAPYFVSFTEVFENASGVTTTDDTDKTKVLRFVPASGDENAFTEYVLHDNTCFFANKTLRNNIVKFFITTPYEYFLCFYSEFVQCKGYVSKDSAAYGNLFDPVCYEGWGVIIINKDELMSSVSSNLRIYLKNVEDAQISEAITIYTESGVIDERYVLEFDGVAGGKEYLAFEGLKDQSFSTSRNYYAGVAKNRKPLSFYAVNRQKLETRFKDINNTEYLKSLLVSENAKKLEASYAAPIDVTVLTDTVRIASTDMFTNQIEIEYES